MNNHIQDIAKVGTGVGLVIKEIIDSVGFKYPGSSTGKTLKKLRLHATDMVIGLTQGPKHTKLQGQQGQRKEDLSLHPEQPEHLFIPKKARKPKQEFIKFSYDIGLDSPSQRLGLPSIGSLEGEQLSNTRRAPSPHRKSQPEDFNGSRKAATDAAIRTDFSVRTAEFSEAKSATPRASPIKITKRREIRVPSTPLGRVLGFAGLGAGLAWGTIQESAKRMWQGQVPGPAILPPLLTDANAERVALALCRMRGAALKVGQMISIQDESLVPAPILQALERVRQGADIMPKEQLLKVIEQELGPNWRSRVRSFDEEPIAAASIGQVHRAVTKEGKEVAMKVQYPGVANSINSDIDNVKTLLYYTNLIPEGLYLEQAMKVAKDEMARECDYKLEAENQKKYRELLKHDKAFYVPMVYDEFSSRRILTTELVRGIPIDKVAKLNQGVRNHVGSELLNLTLRELFVFRFMQTDPNWGNFLYDEDTGKLNLIDFGAARDYPKHFIDNYLRMIHACATENRPQIIHASIQLGFLTGLEPKVMLEAHTQAAIVIGVPFQKPGPFDFCTSNMPKQVIDLGPTMLKHRLTPPPEEGYSLHRKLSGTFLACKKIGAVVRCREMFMQVYNNYKFSDNNGFDHKRTAGYRV